MVRCAHFSHPRDNMVDNPLISIIVPVYNVERYLNRCLDSITQQTYSNLEIILVDDGSTDKSGIICDEYALKDNRIKVLHQKNAGQSCARNVGLDIALGTFIGFVDSDDWIVPDMFEKMHQNLTENNADISNCGIMRKNEKTGMEKRCAPFPFPITGGNQGVHLLLENKLTVVPWNKLFKRNIWDNIRFPAGMWFEDELIMPYLFAKASIISYMDEALYNYNERSGSTIHSSFGKADMDRLLALEDHIIAFATDYPDLELRLKMNYYTACADVFGKALRSKAPKEATKAIFTQLRCYLKNIIPLLHGGNRLEAYIAQCGYTIYAFYRAIRLRMSHKQI